MADEYLTLTSDASLDLFPDSTIGQFRVKLPKTLYLDRSRHQIGLKYISFPHKTKNLEDGSFTVLIHKTDTNDLDWPKHFETRVESGYYKNPNLLKHFLNRAIKKIPELHKTEYAAVREAGINLNKDLNFQYHSNVEKITLDHRTDREEVNFNPEEFQFYVWFSDELLVKLGYFLPDQLANPPPGGDRPINIIRSTGDDVIDRHSQVPHTVDLSLGQTSIFVYSDVIENDRTLGSTLCPLLSIVPFEGGHGKQVHFEPRIVEYCRPRYNTINEISIQLLNDTGERYKFTSGKVYVTLHIKDKFT